MKHFVLKIVGNGCFYYLYGSLSLNFNLLKLWKYQDFLVLLFFPRSHEISVLNNYVKGNQKQCYHIHDTWF